MYQFPRCQHDRPSFLYDLRHGVKIRPCRWQGGVIRVGSHHTASAISNGPVHLPLSTISIFGRVKIRPLDGKDKEESSVGSHHANCDQQWSGASFLGVYKGIEVQLWFLNFMQHVTWKGSSLFFAPSRTRLHRINPPNIETALISNMLIIDWKTYLAARKDNSAGNKDTSVFTDVLSV